MTYYLWIFGWLFFAKYFFSRNKLTRRRIKSNDKNSISGFSITGALIIILPIVLWAGFRDFWFADTWAYYRSFLNYPSTWNGFVKYVPTITKDKAFYIVSGLIKLITDEPRVFFVLIALFQGVCLMIFFRKYSSNYILSLFLFVASTDVISFMFNGIRQFIAVGITLLAAPFIMKKRYIKAIVIVIVASMFHQSALLVIPFIFLVQGEAFNSKTVFFLFCTLLAATFVGQFTNLLDSSLENTQYKNVVSDYTSWEDNGTNPLRVLVYCVPAILAFIGRKRIVKEGGTLINICANMSVVSAGFYIISMVTSGIFIGRLPIYFSLYGYVLLPWELKHLFSKSNTKFLMTATIICYLMFYCYQMFVTYGV